MSKEGGILRERHEHGLRDVMGGMRLAGHAQGGGVDKVDMPLDQFCEGGLRPTLGVVAQQLLVSLLVHSLR